MVIILKIAVNYASSNTFNAQFVLVYAIIVHFVHRYFFVLHNNVATCRSILYYCLCLPC